LEDDVNGLERKGEGKREEEPAEAEQSPGSSCPSSPSSNMAKLTWWPKPKLHQWLIDNPVEAERDVTFMIETEAKV